MDIATTRILEQVIYPPAGCLLLILLGSLFLLLKKVRFGRLLIAGGCLLLYFASLPATSQLLAGVVERIPPLNQQAFVHSDAQAIVVLGGDRYPGAPEYGGTVTGGSSLERVRYAAFLYRRTHLPLAVIGGDPLHSGVSGAVLMKKALETEFGVPVKWSDGRSLTTFDNARYARELLNPQGIHRILLVTSAKHMPRSLFAFRHEGFEVTPAPTGYTTEGVLEKGVLAWLPSARAMKRNDAFFHELIGLVWYEVFVAGEREKH